MTAPEQPPKPRTPRGPAKATTPHPARAPKAKAAPPSGTRLNKFLAQAAHVSRRDADLLIEQGRVDVNGITVTDLGSRVELGVHQVSLDGEKLRVSEARLTIVLNKPVGYLCSASDPEGRPLVYKLVPKGLGLHTVGRLDFNTEGVIVLTTDGDLAERLGHARYSVQRVYEARVRGLPSEETLAKLRRGVRLEDGPARAESAEIVAQTAKNAWIRLVLVEGRNREVRRLMERVGHPVMRLRRVAFAGLTLSGLKPGQWRTLDEAEVAQLESRGHVGPFELPPDPRRKGGQGPRRVTRASVAERDPLAPQKAPPVRTGRPKPPPSPRGKPTGKPSHDWRPPEPTERVTDGRRRKVVREDRHGGQ